MSRSRSNYPALIAFDLDYTLWPLWIELFIGPLRRDVQTVNEVLDGSGGKISLFKDAPEILQRLHGDGVRMAACSRTVAAKLARQALELLLIAPLESSKEGEAMPMIDFFDHVEIYPGSKIHHFTKIHEATGIRFSDMLFFDDEDRNSEVQEKLGVTFCLVPDGLNKDIFEKGLEEWRKRKGYMADELHLDVST